MQRPLEMKSEPNRANSKMINHYRLIGVLFLLPAIIVFFIFMVIPFFNTVILSFQKWDGFSDKTFAGLANYKRLFTDSVFLLSVKNSVFMGFVSAFFSVIVGVLIAWMMMFVFRREGYVYRTILFSPSMIPGVITALIFTFVFEPEMGILNNLLKTVGLHSLMTAWLTNRSTVLGCIIFVAAWKQVGLTMVLCFAGMQSISSSIIESAKLDGASDVKIFTKIILPLIKPIVQLSAIFALMGGLKIYDSVVGLTDGGPSKFSTVIPMWILQNAYSFNKFGYAAAMSIVFVAIILLFTLLSKVLLRGESYEQ